MKNKFIWWLSLMAVFILMLQSCIHDEIANTDPQNHTSTFEVFQKNNGENPDYAKGFALLYNKYRKLNPDYSASVSRRQKEGEPSVYFFIASQVLALDDGSKAVLYPMLQEDKVVGIMGGILNKEEDFVAYKILSEGTDGYAEIINTFEKKLKSRMARGLASREGDDCEGDVSLCGDIEPVVIIRPHTISWNSGNGSSNEPSDNPPNGGCGGFGNCGGGGGGPSAPQQQPKTPCEKTKNIITNPKMQAGLTELKDQSTQGGEKGIKFKADGTPSATIIGEAHSVNFGDKTGYTGGYHNHTPTGIPMLSPPDIDQLLGFARAQPTSNPANVNNAYLGMIAPNGMHYVIWFNGTYDDAIKTFSQDDLDQLKKDYVKREEKLLDNSTYIDFSTGKLNSDGLQRLFFDTLKNMKMEGKVNLQKIEDSGIVKNVTLNNDGNSTTATPCP